MYNYKLFIITDVNEATGNEYVSKYLDAFNSKLLTLSLLHFLCYLHLVLFCTGGGLIYLVIAKLSFKIKSFCFFVINTQIVDHHIQGN